ncbi:MAG: response regulator [Desulfatibacillaceae bacterium]
MPDGLDVIVVDDDRITLELLAEAINTFYTWGDVYVFSDPGEAAYYCNNRETHIAVFVVDVFLGGETGFRFLDSLAERYPGVYEDAVVITGDASEEVVNACLASGISHLLEKPVRPYALQFAVRAVVNKYISFLRKLREDPGFCRECDSFLAQLETRR